MLTNYTRYLAAISNIDRRRRPQSGSRRLRQLHVGARRRSVSGKRNQLHSLVGRVQQSELCVATHFRREFHIVPGECVWTSLFAQSSNYRPMLGSGAVFSCYLIGLQRNASCRAASGWHGERRVFVCSYQPVSLASHKQRRAWLLTRDNSKKKKNKMLTVLSRALQ